ncbi:outer membrane beta-barrel protein [Parvularcula sp. LCG005]|uniref:outer membrane beta-barrel protein n=1 Tax=Parvularcula sp. LCG005 TaxID=3078805 RepID=UPI0029433F29|nr:outer membrane beta-barrel protein [Parvularcula sp. LCG005]WOI52891.1 outer membrane beta-barrel protein [Parvularcula sp. LCG005]
MIKTRLMGSSALGAAGLLLLGQGAVSTAAAQDSLFERDRNISVLERYRPEYAAPGVRAGQFIVKPRLDLGVGWTSNAFALSDVPSDRGLERFEDEADSFVFLRPSIRGETVWSRHAIGFSAYAEAIKNNRFQNETITNLGAAINGQLDLTRTAALFGGASIDRRHEDRQTQTAGFLFEEPVEYTRTRAYLGLQHEMGRVRYKTRIDFADYDFSDALLLPEAVAVPRARVDQDYRDHQRYSLLGQVSLAITRDFSIFLEGEINAREYDQETPYDRDSEGWRVAAGTEFDVTRLSRGRVSLGYFEQDYEDIRLQTANGLSLDAQLEWFPTELTTITLTGRRGIDETAVINAGGYVTTEARLRVDHELRRNVLLYAYGAVGTVDYPDAFPLDEEEGERLTDQSIDRRGLGVGGTYLFNPNVSASLDYRYREQDVAVDLFNGGFNADYNSHDLLLTLTLQR